MSFKLGLRFFMKMDSRILRSVKLSALPKIEKFPGRTHSPDDSQWDLMEEWAGLMSSSPVLELRPICSNMRTLRLRVVHPTYWLPHDGEQQYLYTTLERISKLRESFVRKKLPIVNLFDMDILKSIWRKNLLKSFLSSLVKICD